MLETQSFQFTTFPAFLEGENVRENESITRVECKLFMEQVHNLSMFLHEWSKVSRIIPRLTSVLEVSIDC